MKTCFPFFCLLLVPANLLLAEIPRKPSPAKYSNLWTDSPFTVEPAVVKEPVYNDLQDYVLTGVAPIDGGYRVSMINRKRPNDASIILKTQRPFEGIEIKDVIWGKGNPLDTQVRIARSDGKGATIGFEEKFLVLNKAPVAQPKPGQARQRQAGNPPGTGNPPDRRVPRQRVIPSAPPSPGKQNNR